MQEMTGSKMLWALQTDSDAYLRACNDVAAFNGNGSELVRIPLIALREAPDEGSALARSIGDVFGFRVHLVTGGVNLDGVTDFRAAFIGECYRIHPIWTCGHEMWHLLEGNHKEHCGSRTSRIWDYLVSNAYELRRAIQDGDQVTVFKAHLRSLMRKPPPVRLKPPPASREVVESEVLADVNANMWIDPEFWSALAASDEADDRRYAFSCIRDWLQAHPFESDRDYIGDREAVRKLLVETWISYLRRTSPVEISGRPNAELTNLRDAENN